MRLDFLAALSGVMISLQTRANGELSQSLNNGLEAAFISFGSGLLIIFVITPFNPQIKQGITNLRKAVMNRQIAKWKLLAGSLGGGFVAIQTQVVPIIGVAIYSVASIAGQTAISLIVDRIGLTGGGKRPISFRRILAAMITVFAVIISVIDRINTNLFSMYAVIGGCIAGGLVGFRSALNGEINEHTQQSFTTSLLNFVSGTVFLFLLIVGELIFGKFQWSLIPVGPWWMYTGGVIGVIYIAFISTIVQYIGVLTFTLFSVGGQLLSALVIDVISPSDGVHFSVYLISGIIMTYLGVIAGGVSSSRVKKPQKP